MKQFFLPVILLLTFSMHAQTRRIALRSHSGNHTYRHTGNNESYGIPMHRELYTARLPVVQNISNVTWVADTVNGAIVWRLDTVRAVSYPSAEPVSYQRYVIHDVSELGHVCGKVSSR